MGLHPLTMYLIADRLRQPEGAWQPFEAAGLRRWFFKTTSGDTRSFAAPQAA